MRGDTCQALGHGDQASSMIKPYWVDPIQILKASRLNRFQKVGPKRHENKGAKILLKTGTLGHLRNAESR